MRIVMVGPDLAASGGITSVARSFLASPAWQDTQVDWHSTGRTPWEMAVQIKRFRDQVRSRPAEVYHLHIGAPTFAHPATSLYSSVLRKWAYSQVLHEHRLPVVLHLHGSDGLVQFHQASLAHRRWLDDWFTQASAVVTVSRAMEREVSRWLRDRTPVVHLPNPVETSRFFKAQPTEPRVVFLGAIRPAKGIYDLLEAARTVLRQVPEARFDFVGGGEISELQQRIATIGLEERARCLGPRSAEEVPKILAESAIFCLPSHAEGLPVSILEAMAASLPVVATRIAGIPELVEHGTSGLLVEPHDPGGLAAALTRLLRDPKRCVKMGSEGRARVEQCFERDLLARHLADLWRRVAEDRATCH
jgi:glycosyltransferase involved in cell wall biosynthesis